MSITAQSFRFVADLVRGEAAIVLAPGKEYLVESRLLPLARAGGYADVDAYVTELVRRRDLPAQAQVVEALTTNETSFFRDAEPFTALKTTVFPALAAARGGRRLRVWCAACSSGQEPYSIAITARDTPELGGQAVEVVGTDLSEQMVTKARRAEYSQLEVNRGLPATTLVKHFQRSGVSWRVDPAISAGVSFRTLNLVQPFPAMGRFDIVFIRNVLIYFDVETKRDILRRIRQVMAPDGYLFLGAAEMTTGIDDAWERLPGGRSSIYRLRAASSARSA